MWPGDDGAPGGSLVDEPGCDNTTVSQMCVFHELLQVMFIYGLLFGGVASACGELGLSQCWSGISWRPGSVCRAHQKTPPLLFVRYPIPLLLLLLFSRYSAAHPVRTVPSTLRPRALIMARSRPYLTSQGGGQNCKKHGVSYRYEYCNRDEENGAHGSVSPVEPSSKQRFSFGQPSAKQKVGKVAEKERDEKSSPSLFFSLFDSPGYPSRCYARQGPPPLLRRQRTQTVGAGGGWRRTQVCGQRSDPPNKGRKKKRRKKKSGRTLEASELSGLLGSVADPRSRTGGAGLCAGGRRPGREGVVAAEGSE